MFNFYKHLLYFGFYTLKRGDKVLVEEELGTIIPNRNNGSNTGLNFYYIKYLSFKPGGMGV